MFESIKTFTTSLDGKSLGVGAVLGAATLALASVAYAYFTDKPVADAELSVDEPTPEADIPEDGDSATA